MKKEVFAILLTLFSITTLFGQEDERKYSFQIKPLSFLGMIIANGIDDDSETYNIQFGFEFQYAINNHFNLSLNPYFSATGSKYYEPVENGFIYNYDDEYINDIGYGIVAGLLYRPWGGRLRGMYIGLYPLLGFVHVKFNEINDTLFNIGIMAESGYQWVFKNGFTLALGGGIGYSDFILFPDTKGEYKKTHFLNYPIDLSIRISLGYSF
jgi:hypothetical protein